MVRPITTEVQNSIKLLLIEGHSYSAIQKMYPNVGLSTLSRYKRKFLGDPTSPKGEGFKARRKVKTNFVNTTNKRKRFPWAKKYQHYAVDDWRKWGFFDKTKINMWGSDEKSYYWTDGATELLPHQIESHVQEDGGSVLFLGLITAKEPGYGSTITEGDVNAGVYIDILPTSLLDTLEYCGLDRKSFRFQQDNATPHTSVPTKQWFQRQGFPLKLILDWPSQSPDLNPIEHVWNQQKRRLNAYPARATTIAELEDRIHQEWYKFTKEDCLKYIDSMPNRIKAVIRSKDGPIRY
ncbi:hypothetical protein INT46_000533 [Mucor plumbeus]|uniref:Tc1-like transposase DDE domain-containing protein n=1 Tax=Mucor plumbeus TaxID=97098 RepID=A0A8H7UYW9_9FUNG|nr:hypothetical protein INT46_000533 [Mucor plumbeus]